MKTLSLLTLSLALALPVAAFANGMIFGPNGGIYQRYDHPGGATTFGPNGSIYQRYDHPGGSTTFGPNGQIWQEYRNELGHPQRGGRMGGGLGGIGDLDD
jgi:hypothetical protein